MMRPTSAVVLSGALIFFFVSTSKLTVPLKEHVVRIGSVTNKWNQAEKKKQNLTSAATQALVEELLDKSRKVLNDTWKAELLKRLADIVVACGELCTLNSQKAIENHTVGGNRFFSQLEVPIDCHSILSTPLVDVTDHSVPYPMLDELKPYYGLHGLIDDLYDWKKYDQVYSGKEAMVSLWDVKLVNGMKSKFERGELAGNYGRHEVAKIGRALRTHGNLTGQSVLVIGSEIPWLEAICLSLGARLVTTVEYGRISSQHPLIRTMTPLEMRLRYLNGTLPTFDIVVTYSSIEHSGLGRYGDALNPWGDLLALARAWCVTKDDGGKLMLGVPTGRDCIMYNAHRMYGKHRLALVTANWKLENEVDLGDGMEVHLQMNRSYAYQPAMVFSKVATKHQ